MKTKERMEIPLTEMPTQPPSVRAKNFREVPYGYEEEMAIKEADRCLNCKKPKCVDGCPVRVPIPEFISLVQEGKFLEAAEKIKERNVLPAICGRVCPQETQCEGNCVRGKKGKPVAIGNLERFVADYERNSGNVPEPTRVKKNGKKVAIVGSGPSGLTTAGDLIQQGYEVTVFEAFHLGGGVLVYGIPEFRLPKSVVSYEIQNLENSGVRFEYDSVIGRARSITELFSEDGFDAVYIGVGAGLPVFMNIPGENLQGVYSANEYLTRSNLMKAYLYPEYNTPLLKGKNVVVVGGGNVAMDSARTALRLNADNVYIVYRRARDQMPARGEEIHHAEEEGIQFKLLSNPVTIFGDEYGRVNKVKCQRYELGEPDKSGRARPVPIDGSYFDLDTDLIIIAIGNKANPLITNTTPDLEVNEWGNVTTDDMGRTSIPFVYAGGDIVTGAATVISAMGAGRNAAIAIQEDLFEDKEEEEKMPEKLSLPKQILDLKHAAIYPNTTVLKLNLINVSDEELTQVKIRVSHVQDFFEETLFEVNIPHWPPSEEYEFECPRYHEQEMEYLLIIKDMEKKIMSKIIIASEVMK